MGSGADRQEGPFARRTRLLFVATLACQRGQERCVAGFIGQTRQTDRVDRIGVSKGAND